MSINLSTWFTTLYSYFILKFLCSLNYFYFLFFFQVAQGESAHEDLICNSQNERIKEGDCDGSSAKDWASLAIVFVGIFLLGIGVSFYFSFGIPFIDDNTERSNRYVLFHRVFKFFPMAIAD